MCWILDFGGYSMKNAPPLKVSMHCNHVLQNHYPERLGLAICYHAPTLFSLTWKVRAGIGVGRCGWGWFHGDGPIQGPPPDIIAAVMSRSVVIALRAQSDTA